MTSDTRATAESGDQRLGALVCDGAGRARQVPLSEASNELAAPEWLWLHLDYADPEHEHWLREQSGLNPLSSNALLEQETRPRLVSDDNHMLLILRGVNLNPGAEPDDMISLRLWFEERRVISLRHRRLLAIHEVRSQLLDGKGPRTPGALLAAIAGQLVDRQSGVVDALEDTIDGVEEMIVGHPANELRARIADFRRQAIGLRRYLAPQRDVMARLVHEPVDWLDDHLRARLREIAEHQFRLVEEVDSARERASVAHEELAGQLSEQMNRNMYALSLVAGVFLPLGLLTGLLGINVGGMPGTDSHYAFWIVCALLAVLAVVMVWVFRRNRLM